MPDAIFSAIGVAYVALGAWNALLFVNALWPRGEG